MPERRYSDDEIAAILKLAAERQQLLASSADGALLPTDAPGLTLAEVQNIARDVGIPSELVAQAARSLDRAGRPAVRRYLGLPVGVGRTVSLQRPLSQQEWERLVVDLRETFDARGRVREEGGGAFRQWTNGNLQALVEPTATGHQVRLRTLHGLAYTYINTGIAVLGASAVIETANLLGLLHGAPAALLASVGAVMVALGAARLPRWARTRQSQMEAIAARLTEKDADAPGRLPAGE